jgi:hypothetical protein
VTGIAHTLLAMVTVENAVIAMIFGSLVSAVVATYRRRAPLPWLAVGAVVPVISVVVLLAIAPLPEYATEAW